jgi:disulfide bond formation protein DsbB
MPSNRTLLLALAFTCFALLGGALYFQHVKYMPPCPMCVLQRYAFLCIGIFALVGASVKKPTPWVALSLVSALAGAGVVIKHLYVLANPGFSCGIDPMETLLNKIPSATLMPWLFQAEGLCSDAGDLILGLALPHWSAVAFATMIAGLVFMLLRRR